MRVRNKVWREVKELHVINTIEKMTGKMEIEVGGRNESHNFKNFFQHLISENKGVKI